MVQTTMNGKKYDDWDFLGVNTVQHIHGIHPYPARMPPQLPAKIIKRYAKDKDVILDPFCGSGTVLVESLLQKHSCIGVDINPLAELMSKVKTTYIPHDSLNGGLNTISELIQNSFSTANLSDESLVPFDEETMNSVNLQYWFKDETINELTVIKNLFPIIEEKVDTNVFNLFKVIFARTIREVSSARLGEFKLFRIPKEKWEKHGPNTEKTFFTILSDAKSRILQFNSLLSQEVKKGKINSNIIKEDNTIAAKKLKYDLIITSPPYGDSRTTVAYGQFSRYALIWLGLPKEEVYPIDEESLGGKGAQTEDFENDIINDIFDLIESESEKRAQDYLKFVSDYYRSSESLLGNLKKGGKACIVIGARTMAGIPVDNPQITVEIGKMLGCEEIARHQRTISSKVLPMKNEVTATINTEEIVVLEKK